MSCRMFSRIPRLYPLEVSSNPPTPVMTTKISQKVPNVPWRAKITPLRTTLLYRRLHGFPYNILPFGKNEEAECLRLFPSKIFRYTQMASEGKYLVHFEITIKHLI